MVRDEITRSWYSVAGADDPLFQGDILRNCPVLMNPAETVDEGDEISAVSQEADVVVLSQTCDLVQGKAPLILVSEIRTLTGFRQDRPSTDNKFLENVRRGYVHALHLLNKCPLGGFNNDILVVNFHFTFSLDRGSFQRFVKDYGDRIRLLSPYREHLSQAFARFFMRVGLPADIPRFH